MKVLVLSGYGINCEDETLNSFKAVGIKGIIVHINDLINNPGMLKNFQIFAIPGGFSYGDHTGSGNAMAHKIKNNLFEDIINFIEKDKLGIGTNVSTAGRMVSFRKMGKASFTHIQDEGGKIQIYLKNTMEEPFLF